MNSSSFNQIDYYFFVLFRFQVCSVAEWRSNSIEFLSFVEKYHQECIGYLSFLYGILKLIWFWYWYKWTVRYERLLDDKTRVWIDWWCILCEMSFIFHCFTSCVECLKEELLYLNTQITTLRNSDHWSLLKYRMEKQTTDATLTLCKQFKLLELFKAWQNH